MRRWQWCTMSNRELRRDFVASSAEFKRENERMTWRGVALLHCYCLQAHLVSGLLHEGAIAHKCKSLLCIVYSEHHLSIMEKFLLICRNFNSCLPLSQQMYTRERTCCDLTDESGITSHSPDAIKVLESGALQWSSALFDSVLSSGCL